MRDYSHGRIRRQVSFLRRQFLQEGNLPFTSVLSEQTMAPALEAIDSCWRARVYSPLVTLWVFLGRVLSADHSCPLAQRVGPALYQVHDANGHLALQDTGVGPQGSLDAHPRLQSHTDDHGASRLPT